MSLTIGDTAPDFTAQPTAGEIAGSVTDDQAKERYPDGWQQPLPYLRIVAAP